LDKGLSKASTLVGFCGVSEDAESLKFWLT